MKCRIPHIHLPRRRERRAYQTCRCGMWRWRSGYRWQVDVEPVRPDDE